MWHVRAPGDEVARVVPICRFRYVGLLSPGLRTGGGEVAVPIVETQAHPADERQITAAGGVGDHGHGRDRRKTSDAIGAVFLDRIDVGRGDDLIDLVPARPHESAETAHGLEASRFLSVFDQALPSLDRRERLARFAPQFHQPTADQGILQPVAAIEIPRIARPAGTAARFVVGHVRPCARIVGLLGLPGDDAAFHVNFPTARTGAIDPMGRAHDLVVLPTHAVGVFPRPVFLPHLAMTVGEDRALLGEIFQSIEKMAHEVSPKNGNQQGISAFLRE